MHRQAPEGEAQPEGAWFSSRSCSCLPSCSSCSSWFRLFLGIALARAQSAPKCWTMDIAHPTPEPSDAAVRRDRTRIRYALLGAAGLVAGIWLAWLGAWALGWDIDDLGIRPRSLGGLIGILTAPFAHASFEHLMSNTLPLGLLSALTLYAYPRATRYALPLIWLASGLGVWLWARPSTHVGISGIAHGLMFFVFVMGLLRRDRLGVALAPREFHDIVA